VGEYTLQGFKAQEFSGWRVGTRALRLLGVNTVEGVQSFVFRFARSVAD